jgi:5'-nucleotidase/UDP-sugar diphosphatase
VVFLRGQAASPMRSKAFALLLSAVTAAAQPAPPEALVILAGDQHSAYERTAQVVATVDRLKVEHPGLPLAILLNGDTLEYGNIVARRSAGAVDFAMFTALARRAPTIVNIGNHEPEFYDPTETIARLQATGVTVVCNITNRATGRPFAPANTKLRLGREEFVVVGVTTDNLATYRVAVRPALDLADPVVWAQKNFPALLGGDAPAIVLSHAGIKADRGIMPLVPAGTLFAGAHDHQRFVHPFERGVYVHSGSWNEYLTLAWLHRDEAGRPRWVVEQIPVSAAGPADAALTAFIKETRAKHLTPEDTVVVAHTIAALGPAEAARLVVGAMREAAGVDAAFVGNTTFGAGLPAGDVTREEFDACVRFDGTIFTAEVDGARLQQLLAAANLGPDTPFELRRGEFSHAAGPAGIDPAKTYRLATTDWGAKNTARYFGEPAITWHEQAGLRLKAAVLAKLNGTNAPPAGR